MRCALVTGCQTCALPISSSRTWWPRAEAPERRDGFQPRATSGAQARPTVRGRHGPAPHVNAAHGHRLIDCSTRTVHGAQMTETSAIDHDPREGFANALTHGVRAAAALAGGAVLSALAAHHGDGWQPTAPIGFGIGLQRRSVASTIHTPAHT